MAIQLAHACSAGRVMISVLVRLVAQDDHVAVRTAVPAAAGAAAAPPPVAPVVAVMPLALLRSAWWRRLRRRRTSGDAVSVLLAVVATARSRLAIVAIAHARVRAGSPLIRTLFGAVVGRDACGAAAAGIGRRGRPAAWSSVRTTSVASEFCSGIISTSALAPVWSSSLDHLAGCAPRCWRGR